MNIEKLKEMSGCEVHNEFEDLEGFGVFDLTEDAHYLWRNRETNKIEVKKATEIFKEIKKKDRFYPPSVWWQDINGIEISEEETNVLMGLERKEMMEYSREKYAPRFEEEADKKILADLEPCMKEMKELGCKYIYIMNRCSKDLDTLWGEVEKSRMGYMLNYSIYLVGYKEEPQKHELLYGGGIMSNKSWQRRYDCFAGKRVYLLDCFNDLSSIEEYNYDENKQLKCEELRLKNRGTYPTLISGEENSDA